MKPFSLKTNLVVVNKVTFVILTLTALAGFISLNLLSAQEKPQVTETPIYAASDNARWSPCEGLSGCEFLQLRGDPKKEPSEAIFRLAAGVHFPKHWHTSPEHIVGIKGRLVINLENGSTYTVGSGSFLYNPGGMIHWGHCSNEESCLYYVYDDKPYDIYLAEKVEAGMEKK